jgi:hypothetical protein
MGRKHQLQTNATGSAPAARCRAGRWLGRWTRYLILSAFGLALTSAPLAGASGNDQRANAAQNDKALFIEADTTIAQARAQLQVPAWSTPVRTVSLREDLLTGAARGRTLVIEPEPGLPFTCSVDRVNRLFERRMTLGGTIMDADDANCAFAVYDDAVAMVLRVPSQQRLYRLQYMGGGTYVVMQIDENLVPECSGTVSPPAQEAPLDSAEIRQPSDGFSHVENAEDFQELSGSAVRSGGGCGGGTPVFDTMIVYTPAARAEAGSHAAIRAEAALAVDQANVAYQNSQINARARLVYANEVDYTEGDSNLTDLERLSDPDDGFLENVHSIRDQHSVRADLVALFTTRGGGIAWCGASENWAFSITNWASSASSFVHAHETGHNVGSAHDLDNVDCSPSEDYGHGWRFTGNNNVQYRTVMAYAPGSRIGHFSNPNISHMGTATGAADHADNARLHNNRDRDVEAFRTTRYDIYVDFARSCSGQPCIGTASLPYNQMAISVSQIAAPRIGAAELPNLYVQGNTTWTGTIDKAMTIHACTGPVRIGAP